jgi:hypothetical protein
MSIGLQTFTAALVPTSPETLAKIQCVHEAVLRCEQVEIATEHLLHGGMYVRTIRLAAGILMVGSLVKLATVLIVNGSTSVLVGEDRVELEGYNVIPGCAGRQQLFVTRHKKECAGGDCDCSVEMTMIFPTQAKTVEEAENEVFAEVELLMSHSDENRNTFTITGE